MREVKKLYEQLLYVIKSELSHESIEAFNDEDDGDNGIHLFKKENELHFPKPKPSQDEQFLVDTAIRQIICAGLVDQVARVATEEDLNYMDISNIYKNQKPYVCMQLGRNEPVYIHPSSCLYGKDPEYIVYTELIKSRKGKTYMKGITSIESSWLIKLVNKNSGLIKLSRPLETPRPYYNFKEDQIECYVRPEINYSTTAISWKLPIVSVEYPYDQISLFSKFLLTGKLIKNLKPSTYITNNIETLVKSKLFFELINELRKIAKLKNGIQIINLNHLKNKWKKQPDFLFKQLEKFFGNKQLKQIWNQLKF
jgi:ATP-dependent RNA helicase DHX37/DHR1